MLETPELSDDGIAAGAFDEIIELAMPEVDVVEAVLDDARHPPLDDPGLYRAGQPPVLLDGLTVGFPDARIATSHNPIVLPDRSDGPPGFLCEGLTQVRFNAAGDQAFAIDECDGIVNTCGGDQAECLGFLNGLTEDGRAYTRFRTLYRSPQRASFGSGRLDGQLALPAGTGVGRRTLSKP